MALDRGRATCRSHGGAPTARHRADRGLRRSHGPATHGAPRLTDLRLGMLDPSVWEKPWCVVYAETIVEIYWAKIGPNFRNRCSERSNSAGVQRSDQRKQLSIGRLTASHAEGHWCDPSRHHPPYICPSGRFCHSAISPSTYR